MWHFFGGRGGGNGRWRKWPHNALNDSSSFYTKYVLRKQYYVLFKNNSEFSTTLSLYTIPIQRKPAACMSDPSAVVKMHQTNFPTNFNYLWDSRNIHTEIRNRLGITEKVCGCTWKSQPLELKFLHGQNNGLWWSLFLQLGRQLGLCPKKKDKTEHLKPFLRSNSM